MKTGDFIEYDLVLESGISGDSYNAMTRQMAMDILVKLQEGSRGTAQCFLEPAMVLVNHVPEFAASMVARYMFGLLKDFSEYDLPEGEDMPLEEVLKEFIKALN
jgi:hypothetical protein